MYRIIQRIFTVVLLCVLLASALDAAPLQRVEVRDAARRHAVCNDGSPAVYYFRPGSGSGLNRWVIFLAGGAFCFSVPSCQLRELTNPELMTSTDKPPTVRVPGILSDARAQNPDFYNANEVGIVYCSSDLWSGNRPKSEATGNYEFRGWTILRAVIADLKNRTSGPNLKTASEVLLGGTSAGGVGVMMHLDWLATQLPHAKVRGLNDAGWIQETSSQILGSSMDSILAQGIQLWSGKQDTSCAAADPSHKQRCYLSSAYPYITTPMFVQESQWDSFILGTVGIDYPFDSVEQAVADRFAAAVRSSLAPVPAAFSPRTYTHGVAPYVRFNGQKVNGQSLRQLLGNWFFTRPGPVKAVQP